MKVELNSKQVAFLCYAVFMAFLLTVGIVTSPYLTIDAMTLFLGIVMWGSSLIVPVMLLLVYDFTSDKKPRG